MDGGGDLLMSSLQLIYRDGAASTVAACLLLKALFLGLHLLALRLPECSGMERLALLHWSFDVWNVWCLAVFARTGRLPWTLETCVVYHVLGYLVYSLVYLHLHSREWAAREGGLSRLSGTPDSELTVRVSEEEEDVMGTAGEPLITPSCAGVLSEDVPDEEPAAEDREDGGRTEAEAGSGGSDGGKEALSTIPEDGPALTNGEPTPPEKVDGDKTEDQGGLEKDQGGLKDQAGPTKDQSEQTGDQGGLRKDQGGPTKGKDQGGPTGDHEGPEKDQRGPTEDQRGPTDDQGLTKNREGLEINEEPKRDISPGRVPPPVSVRPVGAGEPLQKPPAADENQRRDITEDLAAILKAGRQRDSDTDATGFNKYSPVKAERGQPAGSTLSAKIPPVDLNEGQDQPGRQTGDKDEKQDNIQNSGHGELQNGMQNGDHNGPPEEDRKET